MKFIIINGLAVKLNDIKLITVERDLKASNPFKHYLDVIFSFYESSDMFKKLSKQGGSLIQQVKYNGALPDDFETEKFFIYRLVQGIDKNGIFDIEQLINKIGLELREAQRVINKQANN